MGRTAELRAGEGEGAQPARPSAVAAGLRGRRLLVLAFIAWTVLMLATAGVAVVVVRHHQQQAALNDLRPSGIPANVSTQTADLMGLSPVPNRAAPGFALTDQDNRKMALSSFRGKVVVLEFMDPHCTDICPLVSEEFVDAYRDLGRTASKVVFAAVNVNQFHAGVGDMLTYSKEHGLMTIPSWHFFTGAVASLKSVWHAYDIEVVAPNPNADIIHTSIVYFIGPSGRERYIASPMADHTSAGKAYLPADDLSAWGNGIALLAANLAS